MVLIWILGVLAALLVLLCLTRVGVHATLYGGDPTVRVRVGLFRIRIYPPKAKSPKKEAQPQPKKKSEKSAKPKKERPPMPKPQLTDIRDAVHTLWPPLRRALDRTRRGIRLHPLDLSVTVGGREDPAAGAELYGYLHAGVWAAMPVLEQLLVIPAPHIHVGVDFDSAETELSGEIGVSIRIGTVLAMGLGVGIPALKWFLAFRKKQQKQPPAAPQEETEHTAA